MEMIRKIAFPYLVVEENGKKMIKTTYTNKETSNRKERGKTEKGKFQNDNENRFSLVFPPKIRTKRNKKNYYFPFIFLGSKHTLSM